MLNKPKNLVIIGCVGMLISFAFFGNGVMRQIQLFEGGAAHGMGEGTMGSILISFLLGGLISTFATIALIAAAVIHFADQRSGGAGGREPRRS